MTRLADSRPTRLNLLRARRRLTRVVEGEELLRRKREALVRELLGRAGPAVDARERIGRATAAAHTALLDALAHEGRDGVLASAAPAREVPLAMSSTRIWGLAIGAVVQPPVLERTLEARGTAPGLTPAATVEAASAFEALAQLLVEAAPREMLLRALGRAVARTSRQVRALEQRLEPALESAVRRMVAVLDEREREEHLRLRLFLRRRGGARAAAESLLGDP